MGPGVAQEYASTQDGPTIWEDHFYPEIIDPETGAVLPDGEEGELVFTSLTKQAMPIVRYRTRDLTRLLPGTNGPMRRIAKITGRSDDMLIIRGVNLFPSQIEEQILKCAGLAPHYLIEVSRPGRMDQVMVRVETRELCDAAIANSHAKELSAHIKTMIGISIKVETCPPESLRRSEGKAVRVLDLRAKS
jgi:phenylacetate-CoA ligase